MFCQGSGSGGGDESLGKVISAFQSINGRQRFTVELRPGETTIVSWKKLLKDAVKVSGSSSAPEPPSNAHPALKSRISPGQPVINDGKDVPPGSRLSAVIEKIERLYKGKHSSDEEDLNEIPDDDEYDTNDSFIDDTELDEYFEVDNSAIKHGGFFVNRGKLERIENTSLQNQLPKKRRRKDLGKGQGGSDDGHVEKRSAKVGKKATGESALVVANNSSNPSHTASPQVHLEDVNFQNQCLLPSVVPNGDAVMGVKSVDKQKPNVPVSKSHVNRLKDGSDFFDTSNQVFNDKSSVQHMSQLVKTNDMVYDSGALQKEKSNICEQPENNISDGKSSLQTVVPNMQKKEVSTFRQKSSMLDKAIRDLEKLVAESRPPCTDVQFGDAQTVKRRLRPEIKQKLAKVARFAQSSQGKISKELINRLMSIVGHLMQLRTLKRNLNVMINMGLLAKKEKEDRFQQIKKEVIDMIKVRAPLLKSKVLEQQVGVSDNFEGVGSEAKVHKRKFNVDDALEDKICDLYDLYVDGLEEDAGPQVKRLYAELAELWPSGFMDNHGIKRAICRAKERRRALHGRRKQDQEKIKRKMLVSKTEAVQVDTSSIAQPHTQEKQVADFSINGSTSQVKPVSNMATVNTTARIPMPAATNSLSIDRSKHEKGVPNNAGDAKAEAVPRKKVKRKPESELGDAHLRPEKSNSVQGEERHKSQKQAAAVALQSTNVLSAALPSVQQS